jgi:hypothetical protein
MSNNCLARLAGIALAVAIYTLPASAAMVTITSKASSMTIDPASTTMVNSWNVDGVNNLAQMSLWYRVGNVAERSVSSLASTTTLSNTVLGSGTLNRAKMVFTNPGLFRLTYTITLNGQPAGAHNSSTNILIAIDNLSTSTLNMSLFDLIDMSLGGTTNFDASQITGTTFNTGRQTEDLSLASTVSTPAPTRYQVGTPTQLLGQLTDNAASNLTNFAGPVGPGDTAFAFQWDISLASGRSTTISQTQTLSFPETTIIPEPASLSLLAVAGAALLRVRRKALD